MPTGFFWALGLRGLRFRGFGGFSASNKVPFKLLDLWLDESLFFVILCIFCKAL